MRFLGDKSARFLGDKIARFLGDKCEEDKCEVSWRQEGGVFGKKSEASGVIQRMVLEAKCATFLGEKV